MKANADLETAGRNFRLIQKYQPFLEYLMLKRHQSPQSAYMCA